MGCFLSRSKPATAAGDAEQKDDSPIRAPRKSTLPPLDQLPALKAEDFLISKKTGELIIRKPFYIRGQSLQLEELTDCTVFLFDHADSIYVDACKNCKIFIGPVSSSVFVRDCTDCQIVVACQQFRVRDCEKVDCLLYSMTDPIIESSKGMRFGCFQGYYPGIVDHFEEAHLNVFNNHWSAFYDFSAVDSRNWSYLPESTTIEDLLTSVFTQQVAALSGVDSIDFSIVDDGSTARVPDSPSDVRGAHSYSDFFTPEELCVPVTYGSRPRSDDNAALVFFAGNRETEAVEFCNTVKRNGSDVVLIRTRQRKLNEQDKKEIASKSSFQILPTNVIGLEFGGNKCDSFIRSLTEDPSFAGLAMSSGSADARAAGNVFFLEVKESHSLR